MPDNHHLTGPGHFEEAELAAERARDLLEGHDTRFKPDPPGDYTPGPQRDLPLEAAEGHAWAAVAQAHALLAQIALSVQVIETAGVLTESAESAWGSVIR